ncbi:MAG: aldose 1-epimerase [Bacteroidota bacterium]
MFRHKIEQFGKYQKQVLVNEQTGTLLALVPEQSATIIDLQFKNISFLDCCKTDIELDLNNWGKNALLYPFPNRLNGGKYQWHNKTYQFPINDPVTQNALHGFGNSDNFEVTEIELEIDNASIQLMYQYDGSLSYYPFPFTFWVRYSITDQNTFEVILSVQNDGPESLPFGMGWHPYFELSQKVDQAKLHVKDLHMVGIDERMIPTGKRYEYTTYENGRVIGVEVLDNCFAIAQSNGRAFELSLKGEKGYLRYWQETGTNKYNFVQLFTPPNRNALAIEPMTCNVDAFNNGDGLIKVEPGEKVSGSFGFFLKD